jgi:hypothetical protein
VKVPTNMILEGSLVTHSETGFKGVVLSLHDDAAKVKIESGEIFYFAIASLEWTDSGAKPTNPKDQIATDKLPAHLVSPIVKAYQAIAHYLGNVKYGAWNFRSAGARASVYRAALDRHVDAWWEGQDLDPADGTPHLANALACLGILIDAKHSGKLIDDRPPSLDGELAKVRAEFESLMPKIREKYKDKAPRHFTIADTEKVE